MKVLECDSISGKYPLYAWRISISCICTGIDMAYEVTCITIMNYEEQRIVSIANTQFAKSYRMLFALGKTYVCMPRK